MKIKPAKHRTYEQRCRNKKQHHSSVIAFFSFGAVLSYVADVPGLVMLALAVIAYEIYDSTKPPKKSPVRSYPKQEVKHEQ